MNAPQVIAAGPGAAPAAPRRVLVVDDSAAQRALLTRTLARWGYEVTGAADGRAALAACRGARFPLIISDWEMPGMSGLEFCRAFREAQGEHPTWFILLTARTDRETLAAGLDGGADDFLSKPFNTVELRARLSAGERLVAAQAATVAKNAELGLALAELRAAQDAIDRDLIEAEKLQRSLFPPRHRDYGRARVSLLHRASGRIGGDLVGRFEAGCNRIGVFSVDVAGHGIASALMTARIAGHLSVADADRNAALRDGARGPEMLPPAEVAASMNALLTGEWESDLYFTMALAGIDLDSGEVALTQAGHPSTAIVRAAGPVEFVRETGMPVGLIEAAEFSGASARLRPGDRMLLYSDGLTEAPDPVGRQLEEEGLAALLDDLRHLDGLALLDALVLRLADWCGGADFDDDVSAVLVSYG